MPKKKLPKAPKAKKLPKKPKASASLKQLKNYLHKKQQIEQQNSAAIAAHKRAVCKIHSEEKERQQILKRISK